jgi:hypothetical protein
MRSAWPTDFCLVQSVQFRYGAHLTPYLMGTKRSFSGDQAVEAQVTPLFPSSTEFQNEWSSNSTSPYAFIACTGTSYCLNRMFISACKKTSQLPILNEAISLDTLRPILMTSHFLLGFSTNIFSVKCHTKRYTSSKKSWQYPR